MQVVDSGGSAGVGARAPARGDAGCAAPTCTVAPTFMVVAPTFKTGDAWAADRAAVALRDAGPVLVLAIAQTAEAIYRRRVWSRLGFLHMNDYCRERLDRTSRWLQDHAALGTGLAALPELQRAVLGVDGRRPVGRVVATAISRIATGETVTDWIRRARESTVREILEEIRACNAVGEKRPGADEKETGAEAESESEQAGRAGAERADASTVDAASQSLSSDAASQSLSADPAPQSPSADPADVISAAMRRTLDEPEPEIAERVEVRFTVPRSVQAALVEVLDLHRAVSGYEATLASLAEALAAEAAAGPAPPDALIRPLAKELPSQSQIEHALSRATRRWADLAARDAEARAESQGDALQAATIQAALFLDPHAPPPEAKELHMHLRKLLRFERVRERRIGRLLYEMSRRNDWKTLGFASAAHYAVERLGMCRRTAQARVGIVYALRTLPDMKEAYESGRIGLESAWLLTRILGLRSIRRGADRPDRITQQIWVLRARSMTVKRLRDELRMLQLRDLDPKTTIEWEEEARRRDAVRAGQRVRVETVPETVSQTESEAESEWPRPATDETESQWPRPATDAEWVAALFRPPGRTRELLRNMRVPGLDDDNAPLSWLTSADVFVRLRLPVDLAQSFLAAIESARQLAEHTALAMPWDEPWAKETAVSVRAARMFIDRQRRVPGWVGLLALLEDYAATWDDPKSFPRRKWNRTYAFGGWRCQAPGCTARVRIEDHHILYRSHQGSNALYNQLVLCRAHHQQGVHGLLAECTGKAPLDVMWRLGCTDMASFYRNERRLDHDKDEEEDDNAFMARLMAA